MVPATLRGGRWRVSGRAAAGVLLALAVLAVALMTRAGGHGEGVTVVPARPSSAPVAVTSSSAPGGEPAPTMSPGGLQAGAEVVVHVVGQVRTPGLVRVAAGSRVADAVRAAGGATPGADLSRVNLARPVVDGEQVVLPLPGEVVPQPAGQAGGAAAAAGGGAVDLNTADLAALDALPGIGPVLAQRIVDWRTDNGSFTSVDELGEVSGIGDTLLSRLREAVTV